jgi:hypothetical protein
LKHITEPRNAKWILNNLRHLFQWDEINDLQELRNNCSISIVASSERFHVDNEKRELDECGLKQLHS